MSENGQFSKGFCSGFVRELFGRGLESVVRRSYEERFCKTKLPRRYTGNGIKRKWTATLGKKNKLIKRPQKLGKQLLQNVDTQTHVIAEFINGQWNTRFFARFNPDFLHEAIAGFGTFARDDLNVFVAE